MGWDKPPPHDVVERLNRAVDARLLTQAEIADEAGINIKTLRRMLTGQPTKVVTTRQVHAWLDAFERAGRRGRPA